VTLRCCSNPWFSFMALKWTEKAAQANRLQNPRREKEHNRPGSRGLMTIKTPASKPDEERQPMTPFTRCRWERRCPRRRAQHDSAAPRPRAISRPTRTPLFDFETVVILSTISRQTARSPLLSFGSTGNRNRGASVGSVVKAHTVIESVMSKRSS
jgi:hypothetical protein